MGCNEYPDIIFLAGDGLLDGEVAGDSGRHAPLRVRVPVHRPARKPIVSLWRGWVT